MSVFSLKIYGASLCHWSWGLSWVHIVHLFPCPSLVLALSLLRDVLDSWNYQSFTSRTRLSNWTTLWLVLFKSYFKNLCLLWGHENVCSHIGVDLYEEIWSSFIFSNLDPSCSTDSFFHSKYPEIFLYLHIHSSILRINHNLKSN